MQQIVEEAQKISHRR